jgi:hypothetical protein
MKRIIKCILVLVSIITYVKAQNSEWTVYNNHGKHVYVSKEYGNEMWVGTAGGLVIIDKNTEDQTFYTVSNSNLPDENVVDIAREMTNIKWIGTNSGGVAKFDGENWTIYNENNSGLPDNKISSIAVEYDGTKWIGTEEGGLAKLDGTNWTVYNTDNSGLPENQIKSLVIDENDTKWIGTMYSGLVKFNHDNWIVFDTLNSGLPSNSINTITLDNKGLLWIGTYLGGLAIFDRTTTSIIENDLAVNNKVKIYPNPVNDRLSFKFDEDLKIVLIEIINIHGVIVKTQYDIHSKGFVDINELTNGSYVLRLYTNKGQLIEKFIKNKQ